MSEVERIEFLIKLLREEEFTLDLERASALIQSYRWLLDQHKAKTEPIVKIEEPIKEGE